MNSNGSMMTFVMTWTTMLHAIMMEGIAVAHFWISDSAWNANVWVSNTSNYTYSDRRLFQILCLLISGFSCSVDADCHHGFCEDKRCFCLDGFQYQEDCSFFGCKYLQCTLFIMKVSFANMQRPAVDGPRLIS